MHTHIHTYTNTHTYIQTYTRIYTHVHIHVHTHIHIHTYIQTYTHIYTHKYIYIYTHIYTHIYTSLSAYAPVGVPTQPKSAIFLLLQRLIDGFVCDGAGGQKKGLSKALENASTCPLRSNKERKHSLGGRKFPGPTSDIRDLPCEPLRSV